MGHPRAFYNGIRLPKPWPPRRKRLTREPRPVPYLKRPPRVIPIDVGRQLFVDDFLVERTTLRRTFHRAEYHPANPVLTATKRWEYDKGTFWAAPFSDGVWHDPEDGKFKLWYLAGRCEHTCYAESRDGVRWVKPKLDVVPGTNIVLAEVRDSSTVWLDPNDPNRNRRWKLLYWTARRRRSALVLRCSPDGIHWSRPAAVETPAQGDRTTFYFDPFRDRWVYSLRRYAPWECPQPSHLGRIRYYREHADPVAGLRKADARAVPWFGADRLDPQHDNPKYRHIAPQIYTFDAAPYESLMLGQYSVWQGPENDESRRVGNHKRCEILLGFSRDGFHFARPDRRPFLPVDESDGAWNWGNIQSAGGGCLVVDDRLYFYCSGRALDPTGHQGNMAAGLAFLRRDGFASMDARAGAGTLTTRPVRFRGRRLFVNADCPRGALRVEVLDRRGKVIGPFTRAACIPVRGDTTKAEVRWKGADDLSAVRGEAVRFRFQLTRGRLYAFWVSRDAAGASGGYVAGGGPGLPGAKDA